MWGQDGCGRCDETESLLTQLGYEVTKRDASSDLREQCSSVRNEVMSAIQLQGGIFPVVYYPATERAYCVDELSFFTEKG